MAARTFLSRSARQASPSLRLGLNVSRSIASSTQLTKCSNVIQSERYHPSTFAVRSFHSSLPRFSQGKNDWAKKGAIEYKEMKQLTSQPTGEVTIIDVREPDEVAAGMIPSSVNVPLTQFEKAFNPNAGGDFQSNFSFPRPAFDDKLVFYCRSGKRSAQAQEIAKKNGWTNTRNYEGSWLDWVKHEEK